MCRGVQGGEGVVSYHLCDSWSFLFDFELRGLTLVVVASHNLYFVITEVLLILGRGIKGRG